MALSWAYATPVEYRHQTDKSDSGDDLTLARDLEAVSRYLDRELHRPNGFYQEAGDRIYRLAMPCRELLVDDVVSVSAIAIDSARDGSYATAVTGYDLEPFNASSGSEPRPYYVIERMDAYWPAGQRIKVTGVWGWPAVPAAIKDVTIELTAIWRDESARATGRLNEVDQLVPLSPIAQGLVRRIKDAYRLWRVM